FGIEDLKRMLLYADFPPALIPAMIDATYQPITRVDIRRMHRTGVFTESELPRQYGRLGYSPEDAERMSDFTVLYNEDGERTQTATRILNAFRDYLLTEQETLSYMTQLGHEPGMASAKVQGVAIERELAQQQDRVDTLGREWLKNVIDDTTALSRLAELGYSADRIDLIFEQRHRHSPENRRETT
ncbi:unnamed protein product, partial [marine sediment metagenome]